MKSLIQFINEADNYGFSSMDSLRSVPNLITFVDTLKTFFKKYKCKLEKAEVRGKLGRIEIKKVFPKFDNNKKYFFVHYNTSGIRNSSVKSTHIKISINDGDKIYKNFLWTPGGNVEINVGNRSKTTVEDFIDGPDPVKYVYEVPKEFEWLYDYIKNA